MRGKSLRDALAQTGAFEPERAVAIVAQVCRALAAAHDAGMLHRDLKPENIFLTEAAGIDDHVKVFDFGLVWFLGTNTDSRLTQTGWVIGSEGYMSPEQLANREVDGRSDLFAAGVVLRELLTGERFRSNDSATSGVEAPAGMPKVPEGLAKLVGI